MTPALAQSHPSPSRDGAVSFLPCPALYRPALRPRVGQAAGPARTVTGALQAFTQGLLLWRADSAELLLLHSSGRVAIAGSDNALLDLGEPLAPAERILLRVQPCQHATLLWTAGTGLMLLFPHRWQLPLEIAP